MHPISLSSLSKWFSSKIDSIPFCTSCPIKFIYIFLHIYIYTHTHIYIYTYIYLYIYTNIYIYIYINIYMHIYIYTHKAVKNHKNLHCHSVFIFMYIFIFIFITTEFCSTIRPWVQLAVRAILQFRLLLMIHISFRSLPASVTTFILIENLHR